MIKNRTIMRYLSDLQKYNMVIGKVESTKKGAGFITPKPASITDDEIHIPKSLMLDAMHTDIVLVRILQPGTIHRSPEGKVIHVIERGFKTITGTLIRKNKNYAFVRPDIKKIAQDIYIPGFALNGAKDKDKVKIKITKYAEAGKKPVGTIVEVLGQNNDICSDVSAIIESFNVPIDFSKEVIEEVKEIQDSISKKEVSRRLDLRDEVIFTIDGSDAKDLDDAISIKRLDNNNYYLGVHIADVSHYVKENSDLDKDALQRATSIYYPGRVIPMLPKKLSNGVCSLHPDEDRLTLSVFMEINKQGEVEKYLIKESIINSIERMTYKDVADILDGVNDPELERYDYLKDNFLMMDELATILRKKRDNRGAIDFNIPETKILLNEFGVPVDVAPEERRNANRLIEEFMLVCNETVASYVSYMELPFVYRIHESPDTSKMDEFNKFLHNFGYSIKGTQNQVHPKAVQTLIKQVEGSSSEKVINKLMLRNLKQAKYCPENEGHFGLAATHYCHFTSPIRRYPDLQIHRIIKLILNGKMDKKQMDKLNSRVDIVSAISSKKERIAEDIERSVDGLLMAEYMSKHIGKTFKGIISSISNYGFYVELNNTVQGLVKIIELKGDTYIFDKDKYMIIGKNTNKTFAVGDEIDIKVKSINRLKGEINFKLM